MRSSIVSAYVNLISALWNITTYRVSGPYGMSSERSTRPIGIERSTYLNPMSTRKKDRKRDRRLVIFGRYKIHFWDKRHGFSRPARRVAGNIACNKLRRPLSQHPALSLPCLSLSFSLPLFSISSKRGIRRVWNILRDDLPGRDSRTTYRRKFPWECRVSWRIPLSTSPRHWGIACSTLEF